MKKEYSVNVKCNNSGDDWKDCDMANWFESYSDAVGAAEKEFDNSEVEEVIVSTWKDGEIEDSGLKMVKENGIIIQYKNGERLWT